MNKINYQKKLDRLIQEIQEKKEVPTLLLHSCCAPCSSYVLEYLSQYFVITVFFYNPNISPAEEYEKRVHEIQRLIREQPHSHPVQFVEGVYEPERFYAMAKGMEDLPEGGERCFACYRLRLQEAAKLAAEGNYDYFTTTLSISPLKNAEKLNEMGRSFRKSIRFAICLRILRRNAGIRGLWNFQKNMICTDKISAVVFFQDESQKINRN